MSLKALLVTVLTKPVAWHERFWEPLRRVWRLARVRGRAEIAVSCVLTGDLHVIGNGRVRIGEEGYFYRDIHLETQDGGSIEIGNRVVISSGAHLVSFHQLVIEDGVLIGEFTSIRDANHAPSQNGYRDSGHVGAPIRICKNAWVGRGCCILPGVTIGANSIVGANSVVTQDVPANVLAVGAPAKPVKDLNGDNQ